MQRGRRTVPLEKHMMTGAADLEETVGLRLTAVTTKLCSLPSFPLFVGYLIFTSSARPAVSEICKEQHIYSSDEKHEAPLAAVSCVER